MTVRQIIEEYRKLPPPEQEEVWAELRSLRPAAEASCAEYHDAMAKADQLLTQHADLFRKLDQERRLR